MVSKGVKKSIAICLAPALIGGPVLADGDGQRAHHHHHLHDDASPSGVMGGHTHPRGGTMFSYRYMRMQMDGLRDGTDGLSDAEVLRRFKVTPLRMTTEMHMFGAMYAFSDELTLMAMLPWVNKEMDHVTRMGQAFTTRSQGLGDVRLSALYVLGRRPGRQLHLNATLSAPSGDIDERDDTPAQAGARLPYPMQLGSGSWDLLPGITYSAERGPYAWGVQSVATLRLSENDNDYRLGHRFELTAWGGYRFLGRWRGSLRLKGSWWGDVHGADPALNPALVPTADPDLQGGRRVDLLAGVNFYPRDAVFKGQRLALEAGIPVHEKLDGPQMSSQWVINGGWRYVF